MPDIKQSVLAELERRFGRALKLPKSNSLYQFAASAPLRVYFRYSKDHGGKTFFGLRQTDLRQLEGHSAAICFLWDGQREPLFLPFGEYEEIFREARPASDGQYKAQAYLRDESVELLVTTVGRFNVDAHVGWDAVERLATSATLEEIPSLSHSQVQSIIAAIGTSKGCDIWIPPNNRDCLDPALVNRVSIRTQLPAALISIAGALSEIDAIWLNRGSGELRSLFEIEHSTPIYSGLLRFNDFRLSAPASTAQFTVVSNEERRALFVRQVHRPTFVASKLHELCTFLPYSDVYRWFQRIFGPEARIGVPSTVVRHPLERIDGQ